MSDKRCAFPPIDGPATRGIGWPPITCPRGSRRGARTCPGRWNMQHQSCVLFRTWSWMVLLLTLGGLTMVFSADPGGIHSVPTPAALQPDPLSEHYETVTPSLEWTIVHDGAELHI